MSNRTMLSIVAPATLSRAGPGDSSGIDQNHFAVIPNSTHFDIINTTTVSDIAIPFLDGYTQPPQWHSKVDTP